MAQIMAAVHAKMVFVGNFVSAIWAVHFSISFIYEESAVRGRAFSVLQLQLRLPRRGSARPDHPGFGADR